MSRVKLGIAAGQPPDIFISTTPTTLELIELGAIIPLDEYIAAEGGEAWLRDFVPAFLENARVEGHIWYIPWQHSTLIFYWNKDAFREAGLDPERPPQTWDEVIEYAQKLTIRRPDGTVERWGIEIPVEGWPFDALCAQAGQRYIGKPYEVFLNTEAAIDALTFLNDLVNKYKVMPSYRLYGDSANDFVAGKAAMMYNSTGSLAFVRDNAKFAWGTAFLPARKVRGAPTGGGGFYISANISKAKQDAAWKFITWMVEPERTAFWSRQSGYLPVRFSAYNLPEMQEYYAKYPQALTAFKQLEVAFAEAMWYQRFQIFDIINNALEQCLAYNLDPAKVLAEAQQKAEAVLAPYKPGK
jgi:sn-glycerol 3-phosphate transport system substrate-binding protein